ncbi:MAG: hypothetical protein ABSD02_20305 [Steroidobacteraceae bacterium]|jgi:hypothetical protein
MTGKLSTGVILLMLAPAMSQAQSAVRLSSDDGVPSAAAAF